MNEDLISVLILFGLVITYFSFKILSLKKEEKQAHEARQTMSYDSNTKCLTVLERSPQLKEALTIEAAHDIIANYTPDRIIYTGATVGGITTGGFHTEKGGYSMSLGGKTGKYYLSYKFAKYIVTSNPDPRQSQYQSDIVSFVRLTTSDFEEAQNHPILKKLVATEETKKGFHLSGDNILNLFRLTRDEADGVLNWLSGEN